MTKVVQLPGKASVFIGGFIRKFFAVAFLFALAQPFAQAADVCIFSSKDDLEKEITVWENEFAELQKTHGFSDAVNAHVSEFHSCTRFVRDQVRKRLEGARAIVSLASFPLDSKRCEEIVASQDRTRAWLDRYRQVYRDWTGNLPDVCKGPYVKIEYRDPCIRNVLMPISPVQAENLDAFQGAVNQIGHQDEGTPTAADDKKDGDGGKKKGAAEAPQKRMAREVISNIEKSSVQKSLKSLKDERQKLSHLANAGELLIHSELQDSDRKTNPTDQDAQYFALWNERIAFYKKLFVPHGNNEPIEKRIERVVIQVNEDFAKKYESITPLPADGKSTRLIDFLEGNGANCTGGAKLHIAALAAVLGDQLPPNLKLMAQSFGDHVQAVIYDEKENLTWVLRSNTAVHGVKSELYDPGEILNIDLWKHREKKTAHELFLYRKADHEPSDEERKALAKYNENKKAKGDHGSDSYPPSSHSFSNGDLPARFATESYSPTRVIINDSDYKAPALETGAASSAPGRRAKEGAGDSAENSAENSENSAEKGDQPGQPAKKPLVTGSRQWYAQAVGVHQNWGAGKRGFSYQLTSSYKNIYFDSKQDADAFNSISSPEERKDFLLKLRETALVEAVNQARKTGVLEIFDHPERWSDRLKSKEIDNALNQLVAADSQIGRIPTEMHSSPNEEDKNALLAKEQAHKKYPEIDRFIQGGVALEESIKEHPERFLTTINKNPEIAHDLGFLLNEKSRLLNGLGSGSGSISLIAKELIRHAEIHFGEGSSEFKVDAAKKETEKPAPLQPKPRQQEAEKQALRFSELGTGSHEQQKPELSSPPKFISLKKPLKEDLIVAKTSADFSAVAAIELVNELGFGVPATLQTDFNNTIRRIESEGLPAFKKWLMNEKSKEILNQHIDSILSNTEAKSFSDYTDKTSELSKLNKKLFNVIKESMCSSTEKKKLLSESNALIFCSHLEPSARSGSGAFESR